MYKCPKIQSPHYFKSSLLTLPLISTSSCVSSIFLSIEVNWCRSDISEYVKLVKKKNKLAGNYVFPLLSYLKASSSHSYLLLYRNNLDCTSITTLWNFTTSAKPGSESFSFNNILRIWQRFSFVKIPLFKCCTGYPIYSSAPLNVLKL